MVFDRIELFRYLLRLRRYKRKSVEGSVFRRGWVTFSANLIVLYQNVRSALFCFVTKHACDRRTDGQTYRWTEGQNYDSLDRTSIYMSLGETVSLWRILCLILVKAGKLDILL